jgi:cell division protease FtsH
MTAALLEWETIDAEQIDDIIAGRPPRPPKPPAGPSDTPSAPAGGDVAADGTTAVA